MIKDKGGIFLLLILLIGVVSVYGANVDFEWTCNDGLPCTAVVKDSKGNTLYDSLTHEDMLLPTEGDESYPEVMSQEEFDDRIGGIYDSEKKYPSTDPATGDDTGGDDTAGGDETPQEDDCPEKGEKGYEEPEIVEKKEDGDAEKEDETPADDKDKEDTPDDKLNPTEQEILEGGNFDPKSVACRWNELFKANDYNSESKAIKDSINSFLNDDQFTQTNRNKVWAKLDKDARKKFFGEIGNRVGTTITTKGEDGTWGEEGADMVFTPKGGSPVNFGDLKKFVESNGGKGIGVVLTGTTSPKADILLKGVDINGNKVSYNFKVSGIAGLTGNPSLTIEGDKGGFDINTWKVTAGDKSYTWTNHFGKISISGTGDMKLNMDTAGIRKEDTYNFPVLRGENGIDYSVYQGKPADTITPQVALPKDAHSKWYYGWSQEGKEGERYFLVNDKGSVKEVKEATVKNENGIAKVVRTHVKIVGEKKEPVLEAFTPDKIETDILPKGKPKDYKGENYVAVTGNNLELKSNSPKPLQVDVKKKFGDIKLSGNVELANGNFIIKPNTDPKIVEKDGKMSGLIMRQLTKDGGGFAYDMDNLINTEIVDKGVKVLNGRLTLGDGSVVVTPGPQPPATPTQPTPPVGGGTTTPPGGGGTVPVTNYVPTGQRLDGRIVSSFNTNTNTGKKIQSVIQTHFSSAYKQAQSDGKPFNIILSGESCGPCQDFKRDNGLQSGWNSQKRILLLTRPGFGDWGVSIPHVMSSN